MDDSFDQEIKKFSRFPTAKADKSVNIDIRMKNRCCYREPWGGYGIAIKQVDVNDGSFLSGYWIIIRRDGWITQFNLNMIYWITTRPKNFYFTVGNLGQFFKSN